MVVIRESPTFKCMTRKLNTQDSPTDMAKGSPTKAAWPPRSPHEVMLNSPSRRKRDQDYRDTSPTVTKRRRVTSNEPNAALGGDDDEETLQLKLQQIQAQLKLKKLQKAKQNAAVGKETESRSQVQVLHSPKTQRVIENPPDSPKRVQLGIDRGLRAANVSLKRARPEDRESEKDATVKRKTFSKRLLENRLEDQQREKKRDRLEERRSHGFSIHANDGQETSKRTHGANSTQQASREVPKTHAASQSSHQDGMTRKSADSARTKQRPSKGSRSDAGVADLDASENYEHFSGFNLCTRHLSQDTLKEAFTSKTLLSIPALLKDVVAPLYDPPDVEDDYVVHGIIASKSTPYNHAPKHATANSDPDIDSSRSRFMVLKLTDLKWELDLFLFDTAFTRFWKLSPGTVVAILNPGIMPPKPHMRDTGQFSLKLASSEETVLEVGVSSDLGWCKSVKKDGKECGAWIDKRKTEFCEFHRSLGIERARAGRMEVNGMAGVGLFAGQDLQKRGDRGSGRGGRGHKWRGGAKGGENRLLSEGPQFIRSIGETSYMIPKAFGSGGSTARMLDSEDYVHGGLSKSERSQKRLAAFEKERSLTKALGTQGSGIGGEYMRKKHVSEVQPGDVVSDHEGPEKPKTAAELGLLSNGADAVRLSPTKRRAGKASQPSNTVPMGWGGASKRGLQGASREPEELEDQSVFPKVPEMSPRKKARFLSDKKGIRVPGRKSLACTKTSDDDDDGLDIV